MTCTWKDCPNAATSPLTDKNGQEWARLCPEHAEEFEASVGSLDARKVLRSWSLAGKEHHARGKMTDDIARVCGALAELAKGKK
jgi:hypothetical protein